MPERKTLGERYDAVPSWVKFTVATVLTAVVLVLILIFWHALLRLFFHVTGSEDGGSGSTWYGFWSGFGGAIPDFLILGGLITLFRHHNCHVKGCPRIGKVVDGTPYKACHVHHPAHEGTSRNVSVETIHEAHAAATPPPVKPVKKASAKTTEKAQA
jgi:hypothetical protein